MLLHNTKHDMTAKAFRSFQPWGVISGRICVYHGGGREVKEKDKEVKGIVGVMAERGGGARGWNTRKQQRPPSLVLQLACIIS